MEKYAIPDYDLFLYWLAGLVAGEGCFTIRPQKNGKHWRTQMKIKLRDDDLDILIEIQERLELGSVSRCRGHSPGDHSQASWDCASHAACSKLVSIFDAHSVCAKKQRDYLVWREAVLENQKPLKMRNLKKLRFLAEKLKLIRAYEPQEETTFEPDAVQLAFPESEEDDDES